MDTGARGEGGEGKGKKEEREKEEEEKEGQRGRQIRTKKGVEDEGGWDRRRNEN